MNDPALVEVSSIGPSVIAGVSNMHQFIETGCENIRIDVSRLDDFVKKLDEFYVETGCAHSARALVFGALFALGSKSVNRGWKEHAAASLREIFSAPETETCRDFRSVLLLIIKNRMNCAERDVPQEQRDVVLEIQKNAGTIYGFFSSMQHQDVRNALLKYKSYQNRKGKTVEITDLSDDTFMYMASEAVQLTEKILKI